MLDYVEYRIQAVADQQYAYGVSVASIRNRILSCSDPINNECYVVLEAKKISL